MIDIDHGLQRDRKTRGIDPVLQALSVLQRVTQLAAHRHRLPEQPGKAARLRVSGHIAPAVERDFHQRLAALEVAIVLVGEDAELRADGGTVEIGGDIRHPLEPLHIVLPHFVIRMDEVIESSIGAGHDRGDFRTLLHTCLRHAVRQALHSRGRPGRVDEFMHQLDVADADVIGEDIDQVFRFREAVDHRIGVDRERKSHVRSLRLLQCNDEFC